MAAGRPFTLKTPHLRLAGLEFGPPDGTMVLCLHGWLDNAASFEALAEHLPGHRLLALDLPGHGHSEHRPAGALYGFLDLVAEVARAVEALGDGPMSLVGHSLGAGLCSVLAGTWPERFSALVLLEGLGPLPESVEKTPQRFAAALADETRRASSEKRVFKTRDDALARARKTPMKMDDTSRRRLLARGLLEVEGGFTWAADPALRVHSRHRLTEAQALTFLRAIAAPTLIVRARGGFGVLPDAMGERLAAIAGHELVELSGGHHVHLDDPAAVAAVVGPFLARTAGP